MNKKMEILAPAGSMESLVAALRSGANAVYIGGKSFSARSSASNFENEEIAEAAKLCHLYGAKL
jgi:putative protease